MPLYPVTPAATAPVTFDEMVRHLRVDPDQENQDDINGLVAGVTEFVQNATTRQLVTASYRLPLDAFPDDQVIELPLPPLQSVESIKYLDPLGVQQILDPSTYVVDPSSLPGRVVLDTGAKWPQTLAVAGAVTVDFTCGYGDASAVPQSMKAAIKMLAANWFENREATVPGTINELPMGVDSIIQQFRVVQAV